jgi:parallel beta-helix repeat protein
MQSIKNNVAWILAGTMALLLAASWSGIAFGGPLDPPGAPAPSMKTLQEVEPRTPISSIPLTITTPGSYYLTGNLATTGTLGIRIAADDVTLDLSGFTLSTTSTALVLANGAISSSGQSRLAIRNGRITGFALGINLSSGGHDVVIDQIQAEGPSIPGGASTGMFVAPTESLISNCVVRGYPVGITTAGNAQITGCTATNNATWGFLLGSSNIIRDCVSSANGNGISIVDSSTVDNCVVTGNTGVGITAGLTSHMSGNTVSGNTGVGITAGAGAQISGNTVSSNTGIGIQVASGSTVENCSVVSNGNNGIVATGRVLVTNNHVQNNAQAGIVFFGAGKIEGNEVSDNLAGGIAAGFGSHGSIVVKNTASGNGATYGNFQFNDLFSSVSYGPLDPGAADGAWANIAY